MEGNTEIWATLKMVAEMMEADTGDGENISTAKMILEVKALLYVLPVHAFINLFKMTILSDAATCSPLE